MATITTSENFKKVDKHHDFQFFAPSDLFLGEVFWEDFLGDARFFIGFFFCV